MADTNTDDLVYDSDEDSKTSENTTSTKITTGTDNDSHASIHLASFNDFMLKPELMQALSELGFEHPSQVQHECIPSAILGTDVLCQAKSGMGKTAVFVLAVLHQIDSSAKDPTAIVLCHTRELALQVRNEFKRFSKYLTQINPVAFYGGVPITENTTEIEKNKPQIIIGTPGRLVQLVRENYLNLSHIKHFVIDECDKMLDIIEMRNEVQEIYRRTPHNKQVMMFTATLQPQTRETCKRFMRNPQEVIVNDGSKLTLHGLHQFYCKISEREKMKKLVNLLDEIDFNQAIIFTRSVERSKALDEHLRKDKFPSMCIHSSLKQEERISRFHDFKDFKFRILVSTDLYGRGIDIERVNVVINYDMPRDDDSYLHRIGRAGRFGTKGVAVSFISNTTDEEVLQKVQQKFKVQIPDCPDQIDRSLYAHA
eukprot:TRINITY_DN116_c0_g1_i4.p1 TRINITY_DN116_c0_g1~~TRINITY_DN116_c0_g1_i4.p1  ORF type:complete len:425 (-),score=195.73 TRINITY_DN116_c0_g1_i4:151-1425(-)